MKSILRTIFIATSVLISGCGRNTANNEVLAAIDTLCREDHLMMCIVTIGECQPCEIIEKSRYYGELPFGKAIFNRSESDSERLFSQALYTCQFPTAYVIDSNLDIQCIAVGPRSFEKTIDSMLYAKASPCQLRVGEISRDSIPGMLSLALKGLFSYWKQDMPAVKGYALRSKAKGDYFFNNYLLYLSYRHEGKVDSAVYVKGKILEEFSHNVNFHIYDNLIVELERGKN